VRKGRDSRVIADLWRDGVELPPDLVRQLIESDDITPDLIVSVGVAARRLGRQAVAS
jgi:hypothetical protein